MTTITAEYLAQAMGHPLKDAKIFLALRAGEYKTPISAALAFDEWYQYNKAQSRFSNGMCSYFGIEH